MNYTIRGVNNSSRTLRYKQDRIRTGQEHGRAKLNWEKVKVIREEYHNNHISITELAKRYGLTDSPIRSIVNNKTWKQK